MVRNGFSTNAAKPTKGERGMKPHNPELRAQGSGQAWWMAHFSALVKIMQRRGHQSLGGFEHDAMFFVAGCWVKLHNKSPETVEGCVTKSAQSKGCC